MEFVNSGSMYAGATVPTDKTPTLLSVHIPYSVRDNGVTVTSGLRHSRRAARAHGAASPLFFPSDTVTGSTSCEDRDSSLRRSNTTCPVSEEYDAPLPREPSSEISGQLKKPALSPRRIRWCPQSHWVPDAHVVNCMAHDCGNCFSLFNRKNRCKLCGRVFCHSCCANQVLIPSTTPAITNAGGSGDTMKSVGAPPLAPTARSQSPSPLHPQHASSSGGAEVTATECSSPSSSSSTTHRVCNACFYEVQLVISSRDATTGERRRKSRGEFKMLQRALMVNILSFLELGDMAEVAAVSSDLYFLTKDNVIWYQYNMSRQARERERAHTRLSRSKLPKTGPRQKRYQWWHSSSNSSIAGGGGASGASATATAATTSTARSSAINATALGELGFHPAPLLQDATVLSESEAARRAISLHARYNYTQFLDYTRRQEMTRCDGLSAFTVGARVLFSGPVKIAVVGPSGVGKTASILSFFGERPASALGADSTMSFSRYIKTVRLTGGLSVDVTLHIYDLSGLPRYEALRRFICRQCHAVGLCYDPCRKISLVEAADIMMGMEPALGAQPVVVCGLLPSSVRAPPAPPITAMPLEGSCTLRHGNKGGGEELGVSPAAAAVESVAGGNITLDSVSNRSSGGKRLSLSDPLSQSTLMEVEAVNQSAASTTTTATLPTVEVTEAEALGISVRGKASLQCPILDTDRLYQTLIQCLLDRVALATMPAADVIASSGLSAEPDSLASRSTSSMNSLHTTARGAEANVMIAQDLLNLTTQPSVVDILLDT